MRKVNNKRTKSIKRIQSKLGSATKQLLILKTNCHFEVQLIDLSQKKTLKTFSTKALKKRKSMDSVSSVAEMCANYLTENKVSIPPLNTAGYLFHGLIKKFNEVLLLKYEVR